MLKNQHLKDVISQRWNVIVCADRGLYANWLYQLIRHTPYSY